MLQTPTSWVSVDLVLPVSRVIAHPSHQVLIRRWRRRRDRPARPKGSEQERVAKPSTSPVVDQKSRESPWQGALPHGMRARLQLLSRQAHGRGGSISSRLRQHISSQIVEDDSVPNGCAHDRKALFESSSLSLDLRYLVWSDDTCVADPEVTLKIEELEGRGLLGPAAVSEFELEEGQVVVFVLRQVDDWGYANAEHKRVANPNPERAKTLGVDMQVLVSATTNLRPAQNPMLTKVSLPLGSRLPVWLTRRPSWKV
jgi:hypothetical protein